MVRKSLPCIPLQSDLILFAEVSVYLMGLTMIHDRLGSEDFDRHRHTAWLYAEQTGYLFNDLPIPLVFVGLYELEDAWVSGLTKFHSE